MDDEKRLYLWVRVFGSVLLLVTLVIAALAVLVIPIFDEDYSLSEGTVLVIFGTLGGSALALVEVQWRLWRRGDE